MPLWTESLNILSVGSRNLQDSLDSQHIKHTTLNWAPTTFDDPKTSSCLESLLDSMDVALANDRVIDQIQSVQPTLTQFVLAKDVLSCFSELSVIVAGPSQSWEDCVPLVKGAIQEAVREAKYCSEDSVTSYLESGRIKLCSSLEYGVVTTLETVITSTTVLMELVDSNNSIHKIYAPLMLAENNGKTDAWTVHSETQDWARKFLMPTLNQLLENSNGFNLLSFCRDGIRMGSDGRHSIQSMQLLFDSFISHQLLVLTGLSRSSIYNVMLFFKSQPSFIRTLMMAMSSLCLRSVSTVPNSSIITSISHNGQSWAVKVAGLPEPLVMSDVDSGICYAGDSFSLDLFGLGTFLLPYFQYNASLLCGFDMSLDALIKLNSDRCYATHSEFLNVLSVSQPFALGLDIRHLVECGESVSFLQIDPSKSNASVTQEVLPVTVFEELLQQLAESISNP